MDITLLVLAAGMGSRYGGLKQLDEVGPSGETIIDYSVYDAIEAGFNKIVFIIRRDIEKEMEEVIFSKYRDRVKVEYVFQDLNNVPEGVEVPKDRKKPWGTGHAVLMAKDVIHEPFAVINADDFYGKEAFREVANYLKAEQNKPGKFCMAGYQLNKTLSEYGTVSRGVCQVDDEMNLQKVVERTKIGYENGKIVAHDTAEKTLFSGNEYVSMNFWGFSSEIFAELEEQFNIFVQENMENSKAEYYIPSFVTHMINHRSANVKVLETTAQWFGVTYKKDKDHVVSKIKELTNKGAYPEKLWN